MTTLPTRTLSTGTLPTKPLPMARAPAEPNKPVQKIENAQSTARESHQKIAQSHANKTLLEKPQFVRHSNDSHKV